MMRPLHGGGGVAELSDKNLQVEDNFKNSIFFLFFILEKNGKWK